MLNWRNRGGCSSAGRAPDCGSGGRGFESHHPPQCFQQVRSLIHIICPAFLTFVLATSVAIAQGPPTASSPNPEIVTDRPDITESSIVVPRASFQIENGITLTSDHGRRILDLSESLLRVGIARRTELRVGMPNYLGRIAERRSDSGFADVSFGVKRQLGPLPGNLELSLILAVSVPSGSRGVSSDGVDLYIKFPWSRELKHGWSIGGMQSLFWNTENGHRTGVWQPAFYLERQLTRRLDVFSEYGGDYAQRGFPKHVAHFGAAFRITPTQQIDTHFGFGLSHATPNHFIAWGYSLRVDHLWKR